MPELERILELFERQGLMAYEGLTSLPASRNRIHPVNAEVALYSLPTCPADVEYMDQATLYHGTTFKSRELPDRRM